MVSRSPLDFRFLHHDNAPAYQVAATQEFLEEEEAEVKLLKHPAHSPGLVPCDLGLSNQVKLRMEDRCFSSNEKLVTAYHEECSLILKQM